MSDDPTEGVPQHRPGKPPAAFDVVVLAASIGGLHALSTVLAQLPSDFGAAVVIVQHVDRHRRSQMVELLGRKTKLRVVEAEHGMTIGPGVAYVAPPDSHLRVDNACGLLLSKDEVVHFLRPAADPLLASVGAHFGRRATAVILTGSGVDGAAGVMAVKANGGTVIAQDQVTSQNWGMPGAAVATGCVDRVLPLERIGPELVSLIRSRRSDE